MIARVFAAAHLTVHASDSEMLRQCRTEQQMIDAETGVAREGVPELLPERINSLTRMQSPQRVGPALV
jgi:serine phosphatase RsbU (regulator of sigma subunit)